jgi:hypothetical protein
MNTKAQSVCLWLAAVTGGVFLLAYWLFPGFLPPMSPAMTAEQVASFYRTNVGMIRLSMVIYNIFGVMLIPFFMLIVVQMKRMATPSDVLAYAYLGAVGTGSTLFALADLYWLMGAFRPERAPEIIQLLNDLAWISFIAPVGSILARAPDPDVGPA